MTSAAPIPRVQMVQRGQRLEYFTIAWNWLEALAALIFGKWKPVPAALACLLFGFAEAVQIRLQGVILWGQNPIPVQFIQILPYLAAILVLAGFVGHARPPKALGSVFRKE